MIPAIVFILFIASAWAIPKKYCPYVIYAVTLGLVYSTTLPGASVVGSDISGELQVSNYAAVHGWDLTIANANNTSFVIGWFVPQLANLFGVESTWIYKIVLPLFLAAVPVVLYIMFSKLFREKRGLYATLFFISVPVMQLEIATIGKSMFAEMFMALTLLTIMSSVRLGYKAAGILLFGLITVFAHYSLGIILICYVLGIGAWVLVTQYKTEIKRAVTYLVCGLVMLTSFVMYYSYASNGYVMSCVQDISHKLVLVAEKVTSEITTPVDNNNVPATITIGNAPYLPGQQPVIKAAMGGDFINVGWLGKVFRIVQYLTQFLVVLGCLFVLRSKVKGEYKAGILISFGFLAACVFVPIFSNIINVTRFYHVALMFIAIGFIVGTEKITEGIKCIKH